MSKKSIPQLKEYFKVAKRPTEGQFADLLDSYAHLDSEIIKYLATSEYTTYLEFPPNYQVGDYIEFLAFEPDMAFSSGFYEISVAYTRGNIASAATHLAAVSHANPNIWRECGIINKNNFVNGEEDQVAFTIDINGALQRFRIRAIKVLGTLDPMAIVIKIRSINRNLSWNPLKIEGTDTSIIQMQPMTDEWELLVGSAFSPDPAKLALKVKKNGNVGIGNKNPQSKLHIVSNFSTPDQQGSLSVGDAASPNLRIGYNPEYSWVQSHAGAPLQINPMGNNIVLNRDAGNVGIGINNPQAKLDVNGFVTATINNSAISPMNSVGFSINELGSKVCEMSFSRNGNGIVELKTLGSRHLTLGTNGMERIHINATTGNIGIGTQNADQKFTVKGKIHAEDVIVDMNVPADYVFEKYYDNHSSIREDYSMMNLNELESFIKENKHLPEIPSGNKMTQDGVTLGDFQMKLLQKIEELTLYAISQHKEMEQLKSQLNKEGCQKD